MEIQTILPDSNEIFCNICSPNFLVQNKYIDFCILLSKLIKPTVRVHLFLVRCSKRVETVLRSLHLTVNIETITMSCGKIT